MKDLRLVFWAVVGLYIATVLQMSVAPRVSIFGIGPHFPLLFTAVFSLKSSRLGTTAIGFFAGLCEGALAGVNMAHYVISRTVAAFFGGSAQGLGFQPATSTAAFVAVAVTFVAQLMLTFLAPAGGFGRMLGDTIGSAIVNGALAVPLFALLKKL